MASLESAIRIGRDKGDGIGSRWRHDLDHDPDGGCGEPPQRALLPRGDDCTDGVVVVHGGAGTHERETPSRALPAAAHGPSSRQAAAFAKRRLDPREVGQTVGAELYAAQATNDAPLWQQELEHLPTLRGASSRVRQGMETTVKLRATAVVLLALAATGCGGAHHAVKAIAYTKFLQGGGEEVWIAAPDGSHKRRLARGGSPRVSPDGRWVAFQGSCDRGYCEKLLVVRSAGGDPRPLAENVLESTWSPDGRYLLAWAPINEQTGRLLVVDREGGREVEVARGNLVGWSFSPHGDEIAYGRQEGAHSDVFVVSATGGTARPLTHDGRSSSPVWTAKGILVSRAISGRRIPHHGWGANELWLIDPDGGNPRSLSGPLPPRILGSGITGLTPVAWSDGALLAGLINEFGWPPYAVDPRTKTVHRIGSLDFGATADGLSRDGRRVLVEAGGLESARNRRVLVLPFAGGKARIIARFAGDASWNL